MNIKDIIGKNIAVHCDTFQKAILFFKKSIEIGVLNWKFDFDVILRKWNDYESETCFFIDNSGGCWSYSKFNYIVNECKIIEFNDIVFED